MSSLGWRQGTRARPSCAKSTPRLLSSLSRLLVYSFVRFSVRRWRSVGRIMRTYCTGKVLMGLSASIQITGSIRLRQYSALAVNSSIGQESGQPCTCPQELLVERTLGLARPRPRTTAVYIIVVYRCVRHVRNFGSRYVRLEKYPAARRRGECCFGVKARLTLGGGWVD